MLNVRGTRTQVLRGDKRPPCDLWGRRLEDVSPFSSADALQCSLPKEMTWNQLSIKWVPHGTNRVCVCPCVCVCVCDRSSGFGDGVRTRPDKELLLNMEWSRKTSLWLRVTHLLLTSTVTITFTLFSISQNHKSQPPSEGFTICTHRHPWPLSFDLTSDQEQLQRNRKNPFRVKKVKNLQERTEEDQ